MGTMKHKSNKKVTSSRRKNRKRHFDKSPLNRRNRMRGHVIKELRQKYGIKCGLPIVKGMNVRIRKGKHKGAKDKVVQVRRNKYCIYLENKKIERSNGASVYVPFNASNLDIMSLSNKQIAFELKKRQKTIKSRDDLD